MGFDLPLSPEGTIEGECVLTDLETPPPDLGDRHASGQEPIVLLACRDRDAQRWGARWLQRFGCRVHVVDDWVELRRRIGAVSPRLVVTEAAQLREVMESLDECLAGMRSGGHRPPVLAVSASDRQVKQLLELGATDVVRRPVNWAVVGRRAALIAAGEQAREELRTTQGMLEETRTRLRQEAERAERVARVDRLTGLARVRVFDELLERALAARHNSGGSVAVFHLDLHRFSEVNEVLGRRGGDEVLRQAAQRLERLVRSDQVMPRNLSQLVTAAVARSSGAGFRLLVGNAGDPGQVSRVAGAILAEISKPYEVRGTELYVHPALGIAMSPTDGEDSDQLLQCAESAMYEARRHGPGNFRFYNPLLNTSNERTLVLDRKLRRALERDELELYYQPLVDLATARVVGVEALLRWHNRELGEIPPTEFIQVAEDSGQMVAIGGWVLQSACRQLRAWLDGGLPAIRMSINVSRCQLTNGALANRVREALADHRLEPSLLVLELSERGVLGGEIDILDQLRELKSLGVLLAVDDFGTGNSAISYLRSLELDVLKIDRSYISGLAENEDDAAIAAAMVAMAHQLRLQVVAEGAEQATQLDRLREWGCDEFQGFVFSPAVPPDRFLRLVRGLPPGSVGMESAVRESP